MTDDKQIPLWQKLLVAGLLLVDAVWIALDWHRFVADFWPIDRSFVGPNLVASVVQFDILVICGVLLWPPTRARIHAFADRKLGNLHDKIEGRIAALHERVDEQHEERMKQTQALHDERIKLAKAHHKAVLSAITGTVETKPTSGGKANE